MSTNFWVFTGWIWQTPALEPLRSFLRLLTYYLYAAQLIRDLRLPVNPFFLAQNAKNGIWRDGLNAPQKQSKGISQ